jgi:hypothetical protein
MSHPEIGYYPGVSFEEYLTWDCLNNSILKWGLKSMSHMKAALDGKLGVKSKATRVGRAIHTRLLEPEKYGDLLISTPCKGVIKTGKRAGEDCGNEAKFYDQANDYWYCGTHAKGITDYEPHDFVSEEFAADISQIAEKAKSHEVSGLFHLIGGTEVSIVWEYNGVILKSRIDKDCPRPSRVDPLILDIKKVPLGGAEKSSFEKSIANYNYDLQASIYKRACESIDGIPRNVIWIVIEEAYPFEVNVLQCDEPTLRIGHQKFDKLIAQYKECMDSGKWNGYCHTNGYIQKAGLPYWAKKGFKV